MYAKLFGSIVHSTIWREPDYVRLLWITMLALSDKQGHVWASMPGLADAARISVEECKEALARLEAPDEYSRTQEYEGRRIEPIDGGWWLINYAKFQSIKNMDERREKVREAVQRHRTRAKNRAAKHTAESAQPVINVINGNQLKSSNRDVSPSDQIRSDQKDPLHRAREEKDLPDVAVLYHGLAARLGSDQERTALTGVLDRTSSPFAAIRHLTSVLDGHDPNTPRPTVQQFGLALVDLAANGDRWTATLFRAYLKRAAKDLAQGQSVNGGRPTKGGGARNDAALDDWLTKSGGDDGE